MKWPWEVDSWLIKAGFAFQEWSAQLQLQHDYSKEWEKETIYSLKHVGGLSNATDIERQKRK